MEELDSAFSKEIGLPLQEVQERLSKEGLTVERLLGSLRSPIVQEDFSRAASALGVGVVPLILATAQAGCSISTSAEEVASLLEGAARQVALREGRKEGELASAHLVEEDRRQAEHAVAEFLSEEVPHFGGRIVQALFVLGGGLLALGAVGILAPKLFQEVLFLLLALLFLVAGASILFLAHKLDRIVQGVQVPPKRPS